MTEYTNNQDKIQIGTDDLAHVLVGVTVGMPPPHYGTLSAVRMADGSKLILDGAIALGDATSGGIGVLTDGVSQIDIGETGSVYASRAIETHGQLWLHNNGSITSVGSSVVIFKAGSSVIENNGSITASGAGVRGIDFEPSTTAGDVQTIINTGEIRASTALYAWGEGTYRIANSGLIEGETGIDLKLSPTLQPGDNPEWLLSTSEVSNSGTIIGSKYAFYTAGLAELRVTNSGLIVGQMLLGTALNTLINTGRIEGDITFGGGLSSYDGRGGTVEGTINLGQGDDTAYGGAGNETIIGGGGRDFIDGGAGADRMAGGQGNDTYVVDDARDLVVEAPGEGIDTVRASSSYSLDAAAEIELLCTVDAAASVALDLSGSDTANTILGNAGNNRLNGMGGADTLSGLGGDDIYYVDNVNDQVIEAINQGTDTVYTSVSYALSGSAAIEVLRTTNSSGVTAINLTGSSIANTIMGNAGANRLDGKAGADKLYGYGGNDIYYVDDAGDKVIETSSGGTADLVYSSISYTLAAYVEKLYASGSSSISLTGNTLANTIKGNAGANKINGGSGKDTLYGGSGKDIFVFNTKLSSTNIDRLADYKVEDDTIHLENAVFTKLKSGKLASSAFWAGTKAHDKDDRIIYDAAKGYLYYDADGTGSSKQVLFATLAKNLKMTASEFVVI